MLPVSKKHAKAAKIKVIFFISVTIRFEIKPARKKEICISMSTDLC